MELREVLIFALRYAVNGIVKELDKSGIAPAPPKIKAFLVGAMRFLSQLEPDGDGGASGEPLDTEW